MGFMSPALLGGVALVVIPIALHLVMRRQPQRFVFPALRFVKQRRDANRRRLQLRQLLLLALRCLLIVGLAVALARPMLTSGNARDNVDAPTAVALVIDNAPRMAYVTEGAPRLQKAVDAASALIAKLADPNLAAVIDRSRPSAGFAVDLSTAQSRLKNLKTAASPRPLYEAIVEGIKLASTLSDHRQEVFVYSDLAAQAWPLEELQSVTAALAEAPDVRLYVVNMGAEESPNAWLGGVELNSAMLRLGETLRLEVSVEGTLPDASPLVELMVQGADGLLEKKDEQIVRTEQGTAGATSASNRIAFELADLPLGTHQGVLRLVSVDPLPFDNERFFSVTVRPPSRLLLLAQRSSDALFVREALSPSALPEASPGFLCDVRTFDEPTTFDEYDAVWLLDPSSLTDDRLGAFVEYLEAGGGVGLFLGHRIDSVDAWNTPTAQRLLPGKLQRRSRDETYFRPRRYDHPALAGLRNYAEQIPWSLYRVFEFWEFASPLGDDAYVVATFANDQPALVERRVGRGRVLTMTTPFSDRLTPEGREPWNILPTHSDPWPFVALCDQLAGYLSQQGQERLNYMAGETARIGWGGGQSVGNYALRLPSGQMTRRTVAANDDALTIGSTDAIGNYRLISGGKSQKLDVGFSVNIAPQESEVARAAPSTLREALSDDRVTFVTNAADAEKLVVAGGSGRELFNWALVAAALTWSAEHWLANRFYRVTP